MTKSELQTKIKDFKALNTEENIIDIASILKTIDNRGDLARNVFENLTDSNPESPRTILEYELATHLKDIANHGINGGFSGFIYYNETCKFFDENRVEILAMLKEQCQEFGYGDEMEMLRSFNCFKDLEFRLSDIIEIGNFKGASDENFTHTTLKNGLAWYAGEEIAREFVSNRENYESYRDDNDEFILQAKNKLQVYINKGVKKLRADYEKDTMKRLKDVGIGI